ncbi:LLM class F420-dependent oxidoreductase [Nucisporomicrobium flavum]|uniref:LLM class F420-dependent oxidoreductase n=1 Tax=Nucisporomicrobium flavum TaxID=2785915 RepID=UPI003C302B10
MKLGLHIADFTWSGGAPRLGPQLAEVAAAADEAGFDRISVMDHLWQIGVLGPPEHEMLEAYTVLGFLAAHTRRAKLHTLVTGVTYRDPGLLAKAVTTLDVLSGGRAMLGIGAAWNAEESAGLGLFFPPTAERFERLEETLQICLRMFHGEEEAYEGGHYRLGRLLNSPQPLSRPHPPILIGGGGEKKTLRLVAKYADACNLFAGPEIERKLEVLRQHCETEGRDYDDIEKTALVQLDPGEKGEKVDEIVATLTHLAGLGVTVGHGMVAGVTDLGKIEILRTQVMPAVEAL